jgi:hypothetical protein
VASKKFSVVPRLAAWEPPTYDSLESVIKTIEDKHGRLDPVLFKGDVEKFAAQKEDVLNYILKEKHFSETPEFNFSTLADPFGPYRFRIKPEDLVDDEKAESSKEVDEDTLEAATKRKHHAKLDGKDVEEKKSYLKREIER